MKLYHARYTCTLATRIIINELSAICDFERVDLKTKKTATGKDYFGINPKGSVPCLRLDDSSVITENSVIMQYLADNAKAETVLPAVQNMQRYRVLEWLNFITTDLHKSCSPLFNAQVSEEIKTAVFRPILEKKLQIANDLLGEKTYVIGDSFTLGDAYLFVVCGWLAKLNVDLLQFLNLARHFETVKMRPAVMRAIEEEKNSA